MAWEVIVTLLTLFTVLAALVVTRGSTDLVLMAALAFLLITGILGPAEALAGFANLGVITIANLYVVAAGLKETGAVQYWAQRLGTPSSRLLLPMSYAAILGGTCTLIGTSPTWWWMVTDYVRLGSPLSLLVGSTAIGLIPFAWGF